MGRGELFLFRLKKCKAFNRVPAPSQDVEPQFRCDFLRDIAPMLKTIYTQKGSNPLPGWSLSMVSKGPAIEWITSCRPCHHPCPGDHPRQEHFLLAHQPLRTQL